LLISASAQALGKVNGIVQKCLLCCGGGMQHDVIAAPSVFRQNPEIGRQDLDKTQPVVTRTNDTSSVGRQDVEKCA
jgi:hypothetical protein